MPLRLPCLVVWFLCVLSSGLLAHGGAYRFPTPPTAPGTGGPAGRGPTTGGASTAVTDSWARWWEFHKDRYLRVREIVLAGAPVDEAQTAAADSPRPTEAELRDEVIPALVALLKRTDNRDVNTAVMVALGKIGRRHPEHDVLALIRERLERGNQEVRETAGLALGMTGFPEVLGELEALISDTPQGRALVKDSQVDRRTRAFAAYGLGFLARHAQDDETTNHVLTLLETLLPETPPESRDERVALIHALGLIPRDTSTSAGTRQRLRVLKLLEDAATMRLSRGEQIILAHTFTAAAHALGRGDTPDHRRWKERMVESLDPRQDAHIFVRQSAVLALGELCEAPDSSDDAASESELLRKMVLDDKDQIVRRFALMALARIGGLENRDFLILRHRRGKRGTEKPWAAIALGVYAREGELRGDLPDTVISEELLRGFAEVQSGDYPAACAVALGLCREARAELPLRKTLKKSRNQDLRAGYVSLGLCLIGEPKGLEDVREILSEATHRPLLMTQAAVGLAVARDQAGIEELQRILTEDANNVAEMAAIASAFRFVGDRRILPSLLDRLRASTGTMLARAFAAAALGGVCDPRTYAWNAPLAEGLNYLAPISTLLDGVRGVLDIL